MGNMCEIGEGKRHCAETLFEYLAEEGGGWGEGKRELGYYIDGACV